MNEKLKLQFSELMHEIMGKNKEIIDHGDYHNLLSLCEQDISILACLDNKEDLTAKEISGLLNVPKTTVVTAVARLEKRGYLEKIQNVKDRREMYLKLTDKGRKANQEHYDYEEVILSALTNRWSESDQQQLADLLARRELFE